MANEDYHEMEMSRRSIKINTIRQELEDASEREQEAQERLAQLDRQIQEKKVHIVVFKQNAQGMEDQAAAAEAFCLQNHRLMKEDEEDVRSEAEALNEKLAKMARSLEKAQADARQAQRAAEAQEEANKRQAEETAKHAAQLATLEATMAAATADVESIQETIRELEVTLEMEKKTGKELQDSVNAEEEKRQETQLECDRLMHFLESLSSRGNKEELSKALAAMQREHSQLQQELITKKTNVLIKQQEIRGRLDETRRIHAERKVSAADVAAIALNASGPRCCFDCDFGGGEKKSGSCKRDKAAVGGRSQSLGETAGSGSGGSPCPTSDGSKVRERSIWTGGTPDCPREIGRCKEAVAKQG